jgi:hypothetical protein
MDSELSPEILAYYQQAAEQERLQDGVSRLELMRAD